VTFRKRIDKWAGGVVQVAKRPKRRERERERERENLVIIWIREKEP
jgi:hypothetical protein